jgi:hypothetical protein
MANQFVAIMACRDADQNPLGSHGRAERRQLRIGRFAALRENTEEGRVPGQAVRAPVNGKLPNIMVAALPEILSPSTSAVKSRSMGMGLVIETFQAS